METACTLLGALKSFEEDRILVELLLLNGHVDADDILPYNPPSADVEMSRRRRR